MKIVSQGDMRKVLEEFGIALLSGESCNLGLRRTVDVSPAAKPLIEEFMAIKLHQSGMNGWAVDPDGAYHAGYNRAYDYIDRQHIKKEGWSTTDGYGLHMPHVLQHPLFVFLALRHGYRYVLYFIPTKKVLEGFIAQPSYALLDDRAEYDKFQDELAKVRSGEDINFDYELRGMTFSISREYYTWQVFFKEHTLTNRHHFSGKLLV
jgi:hypothetical protein